MRESVSIPVFGNGDIKTPEEAVRRRRESGCSAVMIGRGAIANPWIFHQAAEWEATGRCEVPSLEERGNFMLMHFRCMLESYSSRTACTRFRAYASYYTKGVKGGKHLRMTLNTLLAPEAIERTIAEFFGVQKAQAPPIPVLEA